MSAHAETGGGASISEMVEAAARAKESLGAFVLAPADVIFDALLPGTHSPAEASGHGGGH